MKGKGDMITEKEKRAIFLVRLAIELRKGKAKPSVLINGRYR